MGVDLAELLSDLDALSTESAFRHKFTSAFGSIGFDKYTYVSIGADVDDTNTKGGEPVYLTNLPDKWVAHYAKEKYADYDPVIHDFMTRRLPILWTETYRANSRHERASRVMEDAWENGLQRGLTIPVHGPKGEVGVFSLNSGLSDREFRRVTQTAQFDAQVIAYHLHDAVQRTLLPARRVPLPIPLTDREVEILRWTASGKTAWEIGAILKISERTVNFHIQNVMEKFGVHNKTHAAAKAMGLGLLI